LLLPLFATHASLRLRVNLLLCRFKTCSLPNKNAGPEKDRARHIYLVAGARYANYMQIEIEPFPLVA
jgi:hypothetical protein